MHTKTESFRKLKDRYKNEWLLLSNYTLDKTGGIIKALLLAHSRNRDDIYRQQMRYSQPLAIRYAGEIPKDLLVMF